MPKLVNVKLDLKFPGIGGIAGAWEPDKSEVRAAWDLYVEMVTRTPLGGISSQEGSLRELMDSIYSSFDTTSGILGKSGSTVARPKSGRVLSFGYLAVSMLNRVPHPLFTEWHPKLRNWERDNPQLDEMGWGKNATITRARSTKSAVSFGSTLVCSLKSQMYPY